MGFQIKNFQSVTLAQINHARAVTDKITDFHVGSVARTLIEAPAVEIEELYMQMLLGLRDAIPVATFKSFGFDRLPASRAYGFVTLSRSPAPTASVVVPLGTAFGTSDGRTYQSTQSLTWQAGVLAVRIPVQSTVVGAAGNVAAGGINTTSLSDATYVVSNSEITTGRDIETDAERESRFSEFVRALSRGTMAACGYAVGSAVLLDADGHVDEYVTRVGQLEERGYVRYWLYSNKGLASTALVTRSQALLDGYTDNGTVIPGYRPAGVRVEALVMTERAIALAVQVGMYSGYELTTPVRQSISDLFSTTIRAVQPGTTLYLKTLVESMLAVDGVRIIVPTSTENIACAVGEALVPGVLTITAL